MFNLPQSPSHLGLYSGTDLFQSSLATVPDPGMEQFTEEHAKLLLSKEWLAKADAGKATPYLLKFHYSPQDLSCCILITDTKSVWTEVLNSKQMARRWRACNTPSPGPFAKTADEDAWREQTLELLSQAHTIGGFAELSFEIIDSTYSDLAIELECEAFKWRWEICFLGHKWASEIISKHLIFPLISLNHLTFSTAEVVGEIPDGDVEKAVDKLGRTARRTLDTHIKNAMSKPRIATIIRRITAMFNFVPDLPPVSSTIGKVELKIDQYEPEERAPPRIAQEVFEEKRDSSSKPIPERAASKRERSVEMKNAEPASSETEESDAVPPPAVATKFATSSAVAGPSRTAQGSPLPERHVDTPPPASKPKAEPSDSDSSPHRPVKKAKSKVPPSSDDDSEQDNKTKSARGVSAGGIKRGARQPLKRGGKRF